jgi:hypothetical protein
MSRITFKETPTSNSPTTTIRKLQSPIFSGYNLREDPTPQFSSYNPLCYPTTTGRWIKPPILSLSSHPEI